MLLKNGKNLIWYLVYVCKLELNITYRLKKELKRIILLGKIEMGNQNSVESIIKELGVDKVDKNRDLAFEKKIKQNNFAMTWFERLICQKRCGIDVNNFDRFLKEFKKIMTLTSKMGAGYVL